MTDTQREGTAARGLVSLVGAGPGDPDLITVKGLTRLGEADVVVFDRLANEELLRHVPAHALLIYAGKGPRNHAMTQNEINEILVEHGRAGRRVVRLKGGDPFVFGRGGEEAESLVAAGVPYEVVPGVTSAIAAPAYAGIPVTHRDLTPAFTVVTGHEDPAKEQSAIPWQALAAGPDTVVFLMGVGHLAQISNRLIEAGRSPTTPVAVVRRGTWPDQQVVSGTLADIADRVAEVGLTAPAVTIVGQVSSLSRELAWYSPKGLAGKTVLVTRARAQASSLSRLLESYGAKVIEFPAIRIEPAESYAQLDDALRSVSDYRWMCFTSVNAVTAIDDRLQELGLGWAALSRTRLAAIGPATAHAITGHGADVDYMPDRFVAEAISEGLPDAVGARVLLARADIADDRLVVALEARGAHVDQFVAYRTIVSDENASELVQLFDRGEIDVVTFASSSTVRNLFRAIGESASRYLSRTIIACIGPVTAETAMSMGVQPAVVAPEHTIPGLVHAIREHLSS